MGYGSGFKDALDLVADKTKTNGALNKEFATQMNTAEKKVAQAQIAVSNLGETLLPIVSGVAGGVTDIAHAIDYVAQQYPSITQIAVIFSGIKITTVALSSAMRLLGVTGARSAAQIAMGFGTATTSIIATGTATTALNTRMAGLSGTVHMASGRANNHAVINRHDRIRKHRY